MQHRDATTAFAEAILQGRLSDDEGSPVYAGLFMYMGTDKGVDLFKHVETRKYLAAYVPSQGGKVVWN